MAPPVRLAILGASGYTGSDAIRLLLRHPRVQITALTADRHAGEPVAAVLPFLRGADLPDLVRIEAVDWDQIDAVMCCLPHGTTQTVIADLLRRHQRLRIVDLSADFRLRDAETYAAWYGQPHQATAVQPQAVYGLTEWYGEAIAEARLVACPGCYPTAALLALLPLVRDRIIDADNMVIDAKSGVTGAGRSLKQANLFCEVAEGLHAYGIGRHRHMPEMEQELSVVAGQPVLISFTPHLVPMNRGEFISAYVRLAEGRTVEDARAALAARYDAAPFVRVLPEGEAPATRTVRGSNTCEVAVFPDRRPGHAIVLSAIDNLVKGSSGQAIQNLNLMYGWPQTTGLDQIALFP